MAGRRGFNSRIDVREALFLANFYGEKSPTKANGKESALAAGYDETTSQTAWPRILKKFGDNGMKDSLRAVGITKPYLAMKIKHILETAKASDMIPALRMALVGLGESTDNSGGNVNVNATGPVMVIVGATPERMKALKAAAYVPTREEREAAENARVEKRLQLLREGKLPPLPRIEDGRLSQHHSEMEAIDAEIEDVPNLDKHDDCPPSETRTETR